MDSFTEEIAEPVSPTGESFNTSLLCAYVLGFLELEVPIDDSQTMYLLKDVFLPINPRFSSIMVRDDDGKMRWKRVEVKLEDHIKVPIFPESKSPESELYNQFVDEYVSELLIERTPQNKPLWEIHLIKYPTSNAAGTVIFKLHHSLGDGYSLMGALLSCLQRADDPSLPLSFPSRKPSQPQPANKIFFMKFPSIISSFFNSLSDFGWSILKSRMIEDNKTPVRNGEGGAEFQPCAISNISFSLEQIKEIKSKLGVTTNDVITGMIFYGIRLYMQETDFNTTTANSTALVLLNTRNIGGYQSIQDMMKTDSKSPWGNHLSFLHVPIPTLSQARLSNPLRFIQEAHEIIKKKRSSFTIFLVGWLLEMEMKLRGREVAAKHMYGTMRKSSVIISNLIGPVERMALANHPVKGFYFTVMGTPESVGITIISYVKTVRITLKTQKGFIEEKMFKSCMENAFEVIFKEAMERT